MGYISYFEVYSDAEESKHLEIIEDLHSFSDDAGFGITGDGYCCDGMKWEGFEADIEELSSRHPEVFFTCYRNGEESDDFEKIYARGGKLQSVMGEIVYEEFDEEKLK